MPQTTPSVETILAEAVEIALPRDRKEFVAQACAGNVCLRAEVERLMANHFRAGSFLERPAAVLETALLPSADEAVEIGRASCRERV